MAFNILNNNIYEDLIPFENMTKQLLETLKKHNNVDVARDQITYDTVAVGLLENVELVVALYTKERRLTE